MINESSPQPIAVFIDLENLGAPQGLRAWMQRIDQLFIGLPIGLRKRGYKIQFSYAVASSSGLRKKPLSRHYQQRISGAVAQVGGRMHWSLGIADNALIVEAHKRLALKVLPHAVLLLTNDGDFIPLVEKLKKNGHHVIVAGQEMNRFLRAVASEAIPLQKLVA